MYMIQQSHAFTFPALTGYKSPNNPKVIDKLFKKLIKEGLFSADFDSEYFAGRYAYQFTTSFQGSAIFIFRDLLTNDTFHVGGVKL